MSKNTNLSFLTDYITADITNGRIGINNASPAYAFDVTGIARTSTSTYLATASGNVGIGTTTPATQLSILSLTPSSSTLDAIFNITNDVDSNFRIFVTGSAASDKRTAIGATTNTALAFITNTTERMRITSDGKVVIGGTSISGYGFQVYAAISLTGQLNYTQVTASSGFANETVAVNGSSASYFLNKDTGTSNGSSTTYFNIGGVSNVPGSIIHITLRVSKAATASAINTVAYVQINSVDTIGLTNANGSGANTIIKTFTVVYNSTTGWQITGAIGTF